MSEIYSIDLNNQETAQITTNSILLNITTYYENPDSANHSYVLKLFNSSGNLINILHRVVCNANSNTIENTPCHILINENEQIEILDTYTGSKIYVRLTLLKL